jgi:hypothetical protein
VAHEVAGVGASIAKGIRLKVPTTRPEPQRVGSPRSAPRPARPTLATVGASQRTSGRIATVAWALSDAIKGWIPAPATGRSTHFPGRLAHPARPTRPATNLPWMSTSPAKVATAGRREGS